MPITLINLSITLLGTILILFINHETLNEYVVEGDDKLEMDLDNALEYDDYNYAGNRYEFLY